jgi:hypothetical protein
VICFDIAHKRRRDAAFEALHLGVDAQIVYRYDFPPPSQAIIVDASQRLDKRA